MIHLYYGDGKGKTTAAMGLALRMAGRGGGVVVAQFLKGADSGERYALSQVKGVELLDVPQQVKFLFQMTQEERETEGARALALLSRAGERGLAPGCALVVLDEVCGALEAGLLPPEQVLSLLNRLEEQGRETVLTGRQPPAALFERADYVTEMKKVRHPFDSGAPARPGVEL